MSGNRGIKVFAPAAISNFATGKNILSVAVDQPGDEIIASWNDDIEGTEVISISGQKQGLSKSKNKNSASLAGQLLLDHLGETKGINMQIHKGVPCNSGFSSNASSAVAGVYAVNELLGSPLDKYDLLPFAQKAAATFDVRPFPAQTASILFGGIILHGDVQCNDFQKVYTPHGLHLTIIAPSISYTEKEKFLFFRKSITNEEIIAENGNIASMISAFYTSNFLLLSHSIHHNQCKNQLMRYYPYFEEIEDLAIQEGAIGVGFAGNGPGIFILNPNTLIAGEIEKQLEPVFKKHGTPYSIHQTKINLNGVYKY